MGLKTHHPQYGRYDYALALYDLLLTTLKVVQTHYFVDLPIRHLDYILDDLQCDSHYMWFYKYNFTWPWVVVLLELLVGIILGALRISYIQKKIYPDLEKGKKKKKRRFIERGNDSGETEPLICK